MVVVELATARLTEAAVAAQEQTQRRNHDARYRTNVTFSVNDRVLIRQAGRKSKMDMPYVGPYRIEAVLERDRYRVVGRRNARRDHHEFHVSRLKLWPAGADEEDVYLSEDYYDVDSVVGHKVEQGKTLYRVRWAGYGAADDSWLAMDAMNGACARAALDYIRSLPTAEGNPPRTSPAQVAADEPGGSSAPSAPLATAPPVGAAPATAAERQQMARDERLAARQRRMGNDAP